MRFQILAQPFFFDGTLLAPSDFGAFAIEHDDVPGSQFVAVIPSGRIARRSSEIIKVRSRAARMKFVVADRRARPRFLPAPRGVVALGELLDGTALVSIIARGENGTRNAVKKFRRRFRAGKVCAIGDVTRTDKNHIGCARR